MALISEIRKRSWLLIVMIGLGMGGFLLMDMIGNNQSIFNTSNDVGVIDGTKVDIRAFQNKRESLYGSSGAEGYLQNAGAWDYYVRETILKNEAKAMGFGVSDDELNALFSPTGGRLSPEIQQEPAFTDPATRRFDYQSYQQTFSQVNNLSPEGKAYWRGLEDRVIISRLGQKLTNIVSKAVYTPTWMAEMNYAETNQKVDFRFVAVPYASVSDEDVKVTESEMKSYLSKNAYKYNQDEETRTLEYVSFKVVPTPEDSLINKNKIGDLVEEFTNETNDSLFITANYGTFDQNYFTKDQLSPAIADTIFDFPVGTVYGPYIDGPNYKAVKIVDRMAVPDSVKARHILIQGDRTNPTQLKAAKATADSLKGLLNAGIESFDSLAAKFGTDATRTKGGDLGYAAPGSYVPEFNTLVFYEGKQGVIYTVTTQFGVHVIEITGVKNSGKQGVKLAYISELIVPSEATQNDARNKAFTFISNNRDLESFRKAAEENPELELLSIPGLKRNDYAAGQLGQSQTSRDLVKWLFEAKVGDVGKDEFTYSTEFYDNQYIVPALASLRSKGTPSLASVREEVERAVMDQKKAQNIIEQIGATRNLDEIAGKFSVQAQDARGISFSQPFVSGLGSEPKAIAKAFALNMNEVSEPIEGEKSVILVEVTFRPEAGSVPDIKQARDQASAAVKTQLTQRGVLFDALKKATDITDNRSKFF